MEASAELIADRGEAATSDEFFRSTPFLDAENATHTLRIGTGGGELLAPLIVREIPGTDRLDAISPYGYPGFGGSVAEPLDPGDVDFSATGLVTIFIRHTLGPPRLAGARERNLVQVADTQLPPKSRPSDRNQVNRNRRAGYEVRLLPGRQTAGRDRAGFHAAYEQTMRRASADDRYFFGPAYFDRILESDSAWLALVDAPDGGVAAGSVAVRSDGFIHYYLSGTADAHLRDSPMKNAVTALVEFATERGLPLNLGGGLARGDRLEEFKRGFANRELPWLTSEIVCDSEAYEALSAGRAQTGYFPLYRSG